MNLVAGVETNPDTRNGATKGVLYVHWVPVDWILQRIVSKGDAGEIPEPDNPIKNIQYNYLRDKH
jgi:hypothetical protein